MASQPPTVALVGRTNVGKSSLFNRLTETRSALVSKEPGTTRDRRLESTEWRGVRFLLTDTGGIDIPGHDALNAKMLRQTMTARVDAKVIVFVMDVTIGVTAEDREIVRQLRRERKPVIIAINKAHRPLSVDLGPYYRLGIATVVPVSALTGVGTGDLLDAIVAKLPAGETTPPLKPFTLCIIGKPNVGKSSLLNVLVGHERVIVHDIPGTTREPQQASFTADGKEYTIIDTAGIRKAARHGQSLERISIERSLRALETANLCLFVIDSSEPVSRQDRDLAGFIAGTQVSTIVIANKWDKVPKREPEDERLFKKNLARDLSPLPHAPILPFSALRRKPLKLFYNTLARVRQSYERRLNERESNRIMAKVLRDLPKGKERVGWKLLALEQTDTKPPRFQVTLTGKSPVAAALPHIIEGTMRELYAFEGTPIIIDIVRQRP